MTPEDPGFAAAVRVAKRTLAERIAARATHGQTPVDTTAVAPASPLVEPLPRQPPANPDTPDGVAKPWKKPWDK